jgi:hypothetical protein
VHGLCEDWLSDEQRRKARLGTVSSWQCADAGSQRKAARAKMMFLKYRTTIIDGLNAKNVQSNFAGDLPGLTSFMPHCGHWFVLGDPAFVAAIGQSAA